MNAKVSKYPILSKALVYPTDRVARIANWYIAGPKTKISRAYFHAMLIFTTLASAVRDPSMS
jgi:hypothetical protein